MFVMQFRALHKPGWTDADVKQWEMKMTEVFQGLDIFELDTKNFSDLVKVFAYSQSYVEDEMVRGARIMIPYLSVGFVIMCACSIVSVMSRAYYKHQQNLYKTALAIMACLTPLLACATALAGMFLCGVRFASLLCVVPFLALSIGVDSSYLMIHEWQRVTEQRRESPRRKDSVGERLSEYSLVRRTPLQVLSEVGPAILISCLTNFLADFVGAYFSSPELRLLCIANMLSMVMAFIYQ
ncbi:unnamed protein product, partial [Cylicostephanus goldi]